MQKILDTKLKQQSAGVVFLVLAYGLGSLAIDSGSYWHYSGAFAFLFWGIKLLIRSHKK